MINLNDTVAVTLTKRGAEIASEIEKYHDGVKEYKEGDNFTTELRYIFMVFEKYISRGEIVFANLRKV